MNIPKEEFDAIYNELKRKPIDVNAYRNLAGSGRSQSFGIVNRRSLPPDASRQNWLRPRLYKLLLDFGQKYCPLPFSAITVNQNYRADPHRDKNNRGNSFIVGFGEYTRGRLLIHEGDLSGSHNIRYRPIIYDFSKHLHSVEEFDGERFSLVYYTYARNGLVPQLPPFSVREEEGEYYFYRGDERITKKNGLPHPLRGRKKETVLEKAPQQEGGFSVTFH